MERYEKRYHIGSVIRSLAGHDKNQFFIIIKEEIEYVYLVDGKIRMLQKPKKKKKKHIQPTLYIEDILLEKIKNQSVKDEDIRRVIKEYTTYHAGG